MLNDCNRIFIRGEIASTPIFRETKSGSLLTTFIVAVRRAPSSASKDYLECAAWDALAEKFKDMEKGMPIAFTGTLHRQITRTEGQMNSYYSIVVQQLEELPAEQA